MIQLTKKQELVLNFIKLFISEMGYAPKISEIADHFDYASDNAAQDHVNAIKRKGYITTTPRVARSIVVLADDNNGWVSVDNELPEFGSTVWVRFINGAGGSSYTSAKYVNLKYCAHHDKRIPTWYVNISSGHTLKTVTHWQPILLVKPTE